MNPEDTPEYKAGQQARRELKGEDSCPYYMPRVSVPCIHVDGGHMVAIQRFHLWKAGYNDEDMGM